jgi:NlpE N-terminal domain
MTKTRATLVGVLLLTAMFPSACGSEDAAPSPTAIPEAALVGVFEGRFPCADCERLKTALTLLQDPTSKVPTTYARREVYVGRGDTAYDTRGVWRIHRGASTDPDAIVIELDPDESESLVHYLKVDDNILLLLDEQLRPRVGNASHSFTLSRTR